MSNRTITSANSVFTISVLGLYPVPQTLSNYSVDKAFFSDAIQLAETQMGVDGVLTGGYTPNPVPTTISLQADSPSRDLFTNITQVIKSSREIFVFSGEIVFPSTGEKFTLTRGFLTTVKQMPDAAKVLQPVEYTIMWESADQSFL